MSPRPSIEVLDWFYTESLNYKYWVEHIYPSSAEERKVLIAKPNLDFLLRFCRENGRELRKESVLLEIGAGVGTFAQVARDSGIFRHVLVVEPNPASLQSCVDKGLQAYPSMDALIADFDPECFDVVCAFEVIEHLFDPKEFLLFSRRLLTPRGLFFLTTPCFCSFEVLLNGLLSTTIDHEHLQLFSPASFSELIERSKYQIYSLETSGRLDVSLVKNQLRNYRELESDFGAENFVRHLMTRNPEVLAEFQKFLRYAGLAGNLRALFGRTDSSI
jgi:2-polyprenyl-3-methyl-5-hydroxy-6-metoxy-1,4-benzoquinol methylase